MSDELVEVWRNIIVGDDKSWVLFEHGTCVILMNPPGDLAEQATELLREWGPVHAGSSAGDFSVITLPDGLGWAVTCHHDDILTYVGPDEFEADSPTVAIGLAGRSLRGADADALTIIHVEDTREG